MIGAYHDCRRFSQVEVTQRLNDSELGNDDGYYFCFGVYASILNRAMQPICVPAVSYTISRPVQSTQTELHIIDLRAFCFNPTICAAHFNVTMYDHV